MHRNELFAGSPAGSDVTGRDPVDMTGTTVVVMIVAAVEPPAAYREVVGAGEPDPAELTSGMPNSDPVGGIVPSGVGRVPAVRQERITAFVPVTTI